MVFISLLFLCFCLRYIIILLCEFNGMRVIARFFQMPATETGGGNAAVKDAVNAVNAIEAKEIKGYSMFRKWVDGGQGMNQEMSIVIESQAAHLPIR